jgi:hypothetical protein
LLRGADNAIRQQSRCAHSLRNGALLAAQEQGAVIPVHRLQSHAIGANHNLLATPEENAIAAAQEEARAGFFTGPVWHGDEQTQQAYGGD